MAKVAVVTGAFLCIQEFLPTMRRQADGTIVNVVSDAGLIANAKAGPAYVVSKFGPTTSPTASCWLSTCPRTRSSNSF